MWYVYILKSISDGTFYKGLTNNLERRLLQHNLGRCRSTKSAAPWKVIHYEKYPTRLEAREREKYFKSGQGRDEIKNMIG